MSKIKKSEKEEELDAILDAVHEIMGNGGYEHIDDVNWEVIVDYANRSEHWRDADTLFAALRKRI